MWGLDQMWNSRSTEDLGELVDVHHMDTEKDSAV